MVWVKCLDHQSEFHDSNFWKYTNFKVCRSIDTLPPVQKLYPVSRLVGVPTCEKFTHPNPHSNHPSEAFWTSSTCSCMDLSWFFKPDLVMKQQPRWLLTTPRFTFAIHSNQGSVISYQGERKLAFLSLNGISRPQNTTLKVFSLGIQGIFVSDTYRQTKTAGNPWAFLPTQLWAPWHLILLEIWQFQLLHAPGLVMRQQHGKIHISFGFLVTHEKLPLGLVIWYMFT